MAFSFQTVADIRCECGAAGRLGSILADRFEARRAFIVTDKGVMAAGLLGDAIASLAAAGIAVRIYDGVVADPPESVVLEAVDQAGEADVIIGFGGGSSMDVAKLVAVLLGSDQPLEAMYGVDLVRGARAVPLVQIPTTAGTGSEVTPIAIITTGETTKSGIVAPQLHADLVVLDAALTVGLPPQVTAATGIDAMVHAIEAYTSRLRKNPLSDLLAQKALALLGANLLPALADGRDLAAREAMLLGACLAGQAFANAPVAAVHALAYPLGGIFHISHGLSNALVLPHVLRFNQEAAEASYALLGDILGAGSGSASARATGFIAAVDLLAMRTGIPRRLRDAGVPHSALARLAGEAMKQTRLLVNNPRDVGEADALAIYEAAW